MQCPAPGCAQTIWHCITKDRAEAGVARSTGFGLAEAVGAAAAASPEPPPAAAPCEPPAAAEPREPAEEAAPADGDLLELGVFGAPHGLGGELRLALITDAPEQRLGAPGRLWVRPRTGWTRERGRGPPQPVRRTPSSQRLGGGCVGEGEARGFPALGAGREGDGEGFGVAAPCRPCASGFAGPRGLSGEERWASFSALWSHLRALHEPPHSPCRLRCLPVKQDALSCARQVWLEAGRPTTVKGRPTWLLKLRGVDAPEAAEQLRGLFLLGDAAARPPLDGDDEFYVQVRRPRCAVAAAALYTQS